MTTYRIDGMTLVEVSDRKEPQQNDFIINHDEIEMDDEVEIDWAGFNEAVRGYENHLASLARIPISPELKEWLGDRETVTSDEIQLLDECSNCMFPVQPPCRSDCQHIITKAHPAKPKQSDGDEVWREMLSCQLPIALKAAQDKDPDPEQTLINYLKLNYKLTKR